MRVEQGLIVLWLFGLYHFWLEIDGLALGFLCGDDGCVALRSLLSYVANTEHVNKNVTQEVVEGSIFG